MEKTQTSTTNIHGVTPDKVSVVITDHDWFAVVEVTMGTMQVTLFADSLATAQAMAQALSTPTLKHAQD